LSDCGMCHSSINISANAAADQIYSTMKKKTKEANC